MLPFIKPVLSRLHIVNAQSMNLDKPLDDIIKSNPKKRSTRGRGGRRVSGGGARAAALGKGAANAAQNAAAIAAANRAKAPLVIPGRAPGGKDPGSKIIVGNLPLDVTEAQVKDLFATSIGPLRKVVMSYRANGQSTGQCTVEFQRVNDANRAYQQYNNRLIDGKKAIRIEVVVDPARTAAQVAQTQALQAASGTPAAPKGAAGARGTARGRGARGGRGGRGSTRAKQPKKTVEDLDAEMADYSAKADA